MSRKYQYRPSFHNQVRIFKTAQRAVGAEYEIFTRPPGLEVLNTPNSGNTTIHASRDSDDRSGKGVVVVPTASVLSTGEAGSDSRSTSASNRLEGSPADPERAKQIALRSKAQKSFNNANAWIDGLIAGTNRTYISEGPYDPDLNERLKHDYRAALRNFLTQYDEAYRIYLQLSDSTSAEKVLATFNEKMRGILGNGLKPGNGYDFFAKTRVERSWDKKMDPMEKTVGELHGELGSLFRSYAVISSSGAYISSVFSFPGLDSPFKHLEYCQLVDFAAWTRRDFFMVNQHAIWNDRNFLSLNQLFVPDILNEYAERFLQEAEINKKGGYYLQAFYQYLLHSLVIYTCLLHYGYAEYEDILTGVQQACVDFLKEHRQDLAGQLFGSQTREEYEEHAERFYERTIDETFRRRWPHVPFPIDDDNRSYRAESKTLLERARKTPPMLPWRGPLK